MHRSSRCSNVHDLRRRFTPQANALIRLSPKELLFGRRARFRFFTKESPSILFRKSGARTGGSWLRSTSPQMGGGTTAPQPSKTANGNLLASADFSPSAMWCRLPSFPPMPCVGPISAARTRCGAARLSEKARLARLSQSVHPSQSEKLRQIVCYSEVRAWKTLEKPSCARFENRPGAAAIAARPAADRIASP
jgi:hypothetical protein